MTVSPRFGPAAALALLCGAAAAFAHPPFGLLPGLFGYAGLFWLSDQADPGRPLRSAFWRGWLSGLSYFVVSCWWVAEAFLVDAKNQAWMAPFAVILLAGGLALLWGVASLLYRAVRPRHPVLKVLAFAGALSALEWLRGHLMTGFPWNLPGETWRAGSAPSQAAALVGAYGLTWLTVTLVCALAAPIMLGRRRTTLGLLGAGLILLAGLYGFGLQRLAHAAPAPADAPLVRLVQADVRQESKYDADEFASILDRYLRLTSQAAPRAPDVVIWPEGALPYASNDIFSAESWTLPVITRALAPGQTLLIGGYRVADQADGRSLYYNSLLAFRRAPQGLTPIGAYDKFRLVPFGEYLPADRLMTAVGFKALTHLGEGFTAGSQPQPLAVAGLPLMQPLICYESLFPGFTRQGARLSGRRARWIVNISNDAWFGVTNGPRQHLNLASYRAIEEGLPMARDTPTGVTAMIDAYGRSPADQRLDLTVQGVVDARLPPALPPTLFDRLGDLPFALMLAVSAIGALAGRLRDRRAMAD